MGVDGDRGSDNGGGGHGGADLGVVCGDGDRTRSCVARLSSFSRGHVVFRNVEASLVSCLP